MKTQNQNGIHPTPAILATLTVGQVASHYGIPVAGIFEALETFSSSTGIKVEEAIALDRPAYNFRTDKEIMRKDVLRILSKRKGVFLPAGVIFNALPRTMTRPQFLAIMADLRADGVRRQGKRSKAVYGIAKPSTTPAKGTPTRKLTGKKAKSGKQATA